MKTSIVPFSAELAESLLNSSEQFPVDFDMAWVWLGYTRRDNAARKMKGFKEGFDFLKVEEKTGGRDLQRFYLTVDCFKMLGMLAQTDQGDRVLDILPGVNARGFLTHHLNLLPK